MVLRRAPVDRLGANELTLTTVIICVTASMALTNITITLVTGNANKLKEIGTILGQSKSFRIVSKDIDLPEFQGEDDFIVRAKCKAALDVIKGPVIVEDTSLGFKALGGLPGPYIKWFLKNLGPNGLHRLLTGWDDKSATALCSVAYYDGNDITVFRGEVEGHIVEPRGDNKFGWDPCFQPLGYSQTYAEMDKELKNKISHRFKAFEQLRQHLIK